MFVTSGLMVSIIMKNPVEAKEDKISFHQDGPIAL